MNKEIIDELFRKITSGENARQQLNEYVGRICDLFKAGYLKTKKRCEKEFDDFDFEHSGLFDRTYAFWPSYHFKSFSINQNGELSILTEEYFRGERNSDYLPDLPIEWLYLDYDELKIEIDKYWNGIFEKYKKQIEEKVKKKNEEERNEFERLKQKFEAKSIKS